ncbi:MAG: hypothetical protein K8T89_09415 [Planctomycetes bacterium]|nr:hypothetical protein [Planctomycetota bacterium]
MREFFDLASNPLFVKHVRSRLRRGALLPPLLMILFLSLSILIVHEQIFMQGIQPDSRKAAQFFVILQGIILFLMGGSQVAAAIAHINETGIIDFHRVTPMPSKVQTIGILLGAPIRELILFAITLPFSFYIAASGDLGLGNWCKLLLVQIGAAILYYTLAMVSGMSAHSSRGASGRYVTLLAVMNLIAVRLYAVGIYGPTLITIVPIFEEVFVDEAVAQRGPAAGQNPNAPPVPDHEITFYSAKIPVVLQSLMFQGTFITFFFLAASRRVRSDRLPLYSKPTALLFFTCITLLTLGSVWESARMLQILGLVYFLTLSGIMLARSITPGVGEISKGMQRAWKMTNSRVPPWSDLAASKVMVLLFGGIMLSSAALAILLSPVRPLPLILQIFPPRNEFQPWPPLLVGLLTLLWYGFALQYFMIANYLRAKMLMATLVVVVSVLPLMFGGMFSNANDEFGTIFMAISPITGIMNAGAISIGLVEPFPVQVAAIAPAALLALMFFALLFTAERRLLNKVHAENRKEEVDRER